MHYRALDGLRGICALFVCVLHIRLNSHFFYTDFVRNSYLFVDFFFVLSGFVIGSAYLDRMNNMTQFFNFIVKRIGRIWPLHIFVLCLFLALEIAKYLAQNAYGMESNSMAFQGRFLFEALLSNIILLHSMGLHDTLSWNSPSWSISVEFYTYISFALLLLAGIYNKYAFVLVSVAAVTILLLMPIKDMDITYDYGFIRCIAGFFLGVYLNVLRTRKLANLGLSISNANLLEICSCILVFYFVTTYGHQKISILAPFVFGIVVLVFSFEKGVISTLLTSKPIQLLGLLSFTIYMLHSFIITVAWRTIYLIQKKTDIELIRRNSNEGESEIVDFGNFFVGDGVLIVYLGLVVLVSYFIYKYFESPAKDFFVGIANSRFNTKKNGGSQ